eukprot:1015755-Rhodomonas_salina.1
MFQCKFTDAAHEACARGLTWEADPTFKQPATLRTSTLTGCDEARAAIGKLCRTCAGQEANAILEFDSESIPATSVGKCERVSPR